MKKNDTYIVITLSAAGAVPPLHIPGTCGYLVACIVRPSTLEFSLGLLQLVPSLARWIVMRFATRQVYCELLSLQVAPYYTRGFAQRGTAWP